MAKELPKPTSTASTTAPTRILSTLSGATINRAITTSLNSSRGLSIRAATRLSPKTSIRALRASIALVRRVSTTATTKSSARPREIASDPLDILFCGADDFSRISLVSLNQERLRNPDLIRSIHVVCKVPKPHGRGLKNTREVPIYRLANELSLPLSSISSFRGWQPSREYNLVIAASFGLLIPSRILEGAKYGGLNVHPSTLPEFRGAAPLHHTLLAGRKYIGLSLQTLHPTSFDRGEILMQAPGDGFEIPRANEATISRLIDFIAPKAGEMLLQGLRNRVFVPPLEPLKPRLPASLAPRITSESRRINWASWTADRIIRSQRVLERLWNVSTGIAGEHRLIWTSAFKKVYVNSNGVVSTDDGKYLPDSEVCFPTCDGQILATSQMIVSGQQQKAAKDAMCQKGFQFLRPSPSLLDRDPWLKMTTHLN